MGKKSWRKKIVILIKICGFFFLKKKEGKRKLSDAKILKWGWGALETKATDSKVYFVLIQTTF